MKNRYISIYRKHLKSKSLRYLKNNAKITIKKFMKKNIKEI